MFWRGNVDSKNTTTIPHLLYPFRAVTTRLRQSKIPHVVKSINRHLVSCSTGTPCVRGPRLTDNTAESNTTEGHHDWNDTVSISTVLSVSWTLYTAFKMPLIYIPLAALWTWETGTVNISTKTALTQFIAHSKFKLHHREHFNHPAPAAASKTKACLYLHGT